MTTAFRCIRFQAKSANNSLNESTNQFMVRGFLAQGAATSMKCLFLFLRLKEGPIALQSDER